MSNVKTKAENRDEKRQAKQKMKVSGKRVFQLQAVILKKAKIKK